MTALLSWTASSISVCFCSYLTQSETKLWHLLTAPWQQRKAQLNMWGCCGWDD